MNKHCLLLFLLFITASVQAQVVRVYGKVMNNKYEPLPYASVHLKTSSVGTVSGEDGSYELFINKGTYEIVVSMMGYKTRILPMVVNEETLQNVVLEDDEERNTLQEVLIKVKLKDRAEEIMRKLVENKDRIQAQTKAYSYKAYIKAVQQDSGQIVKNTTPSGNDPFAGMAMTEILMNVDRENDKIKEERVGVKTSGKPRHLFYLSATEGDFNFYDNLVQIPSISPTPFVSPVSTTGLMAYKFKTLSIQRKGRE
jgi:hypothetical protein